MVRLYDLFIRIRLRLAARRTLTAKNRVMSTIQESRGTTQQLDKRYGQFLALAARKERIAVEYKRLLRLHHKTDCPILRIRLEIGEPQVASQAQKKLTAFDRTLALTRHQYGDWGDIPAADWRYNNVASQSGEGKIHSQYRCENGGYICIETDVAKRQTQIQWEDAT